MGCANHETNLLNISRICSVRIIEIEIKIEMDWDEKFWELKSKSKSLSGKIIKSLEESGD